VSGLKAGAPAIAPGWTLDLMARHSLDFWLTSEDLPEPTNRVTLDAKGGIVLSYKPNNEEGHARLIAKLKHLMKQQAKCHVHGHECHQGLFARNLFLGQRIPLAGVAHDSLRQGPSHQRVGRELQGPRRGQPLCFAGKDHLQGDNPVLAGWVNPQQRGRCGPHQYPCTPQGNARKRKRL